MSRPRVAALLALSEQRRSWLCGRLERGEGRMSPTKARRQSEIVRRNILGGESQAALCGEFAISPQQFYADRRDGIRRAVAALAAEPVALPARGASTRIAQAAALHEAGASLRAAELLDDSADDEPSLAALALALEVAADVGRDRVALEEERWLGRRERSEGAERRRADAALAWIDSTVAERRGDRPRFRDAFVRAVAALRCCAGDDARGALALARYLVAAVPSLVDHGDSWLAREAIDEAARIIAVFDGAPVALRAMLHANRAFALSTEPGSLARASAEGRAALALARTNALPRTTWVCLYLRVFEDIWRGDADAALDDAWELFTSVEASDSRPWRRIARSRLSNAFSALGRLDDADRAIEPFRDSADPLYALQSCALAFRRERYPEVLAVAARVCANFASATAAFRANALLYSAASAHRLRDLGRARAEISDAVALFESSPAPNLFIAQRAYALGHAITGRSRYRDAARDLQNAFDAAHDTVGIPSRGSALTRRQGEVARLAAAGATNRTIAARLGISTRTVGNHLVAAFAALDIRARWQLEEALRKVYANETAS